jgi:hypothetical protein
MYSDNKLKINKMKKIEVKEEKHIVCYSEDQKVIHYVHAKPGNVLQSELANIEEFALLFDAKAKVNKLAEDDTYFDVLNGNVETQE